MRMSDRLKMPGVPLQCTAICVWVRVWGGGEGGGEKAQGQRQGQQQQRRTKTRTQDEAYYAWEVTECMFKLRRSGQVPAGGASSHAQQQQQPRA